MTDVQQRTASTRPTPAPSLPHRHHSHTPSRPLPRGQDSALPWEQMSNAYAWVAGQADAAVTGAPKRSFTTADWVREQQALLQAPPPRGERAREGARAGRIRRHEWEEIIYVYGTGAGAAEWAKEEGRARRVAEERARARARVEEEVRRLELRFLARREEEVRAREEVRRRAAAAERREKEGRDRAKLERLVVDAWAGYEAGWAALASSSGGAPPLGFKSTPWPLIVQPRNAGDLTRDAIVAFLFSPLHSEGMSRKERIRSAQLRWHPDRFRRFEGRISAEEKGAVEEGVGIVARCLNELMEREKRRKL